MPKFATEMSAVLNMQPFWNLKKKHLDNYATIDNYSTNTRQFAAAGMEFLLYTR